MNADDSENSIDANPLEFSQERVGNSDLVGHSCLRILEHVLLATKRHKDRKRDPFCDFCALFVASQYLPLLQEISHNLVKLIRLLDVTEMASIGNDLQFHTGRNLVPHRRYLILDTPDQ